MMFHIVKLFKPPNSKSQFSLAAGRKTASLIGHEPSWRQKH